MVPLKPDGGVSLKPPSCVNVTVAPTSGVCFTSVTVIALQGVVGISLASSELALVPPAMTRGTSIGVV